MSESATLERPDRVVLTAEEYEALKAGQGHARRETVVVDADEYRAMRARDESAKQILGQLDLTRARMRELEGLLRREQADHQQECDQMLKRIKSLGG